MAQKKKKPAQPAPRAAEPRMYGDGKPSQPVDGAAPVAAPAQPTVRTAGTTPRTTSRASASGSYARTDKITDYTYVKQDLRRLGIAAAGILGILVLLGIILP